MKFNCKIAQHCELLGDCLKTERNIPYDTFFRLVKCGLYQYYCYDNRIKVHRYLIKRIDLNYNLSCWLHYYGKRVPIK